jgi:hypothetical protein
VRGLTHDEESALRRAAAREYQTIDYDMAVTLHGHGRITCVGCANPATCRRQEPHSHHGITQSGKEALACMDALRGCEVTA